MPAFTLPDPATGALVSADSLAGAPAVVAFVCNHCPFVEHVARQLSQLDGESRRDGWRLLAINSNDPRTYPEDAPDRMPTTARRWHWTFPYLFDESQDVARAYGAACTPDFFLFDARGSLAYRGQLDPSSPRNGLPCDGTSLRSAIALVLAGQAVPEPHAPSIGCNVKWRP